MLLPVNALISATRRLEAGGVLIDLSQACAISIHEGLESGF
jgi:hypothetical protein